MYIDQIINVMQTSFLNQMMGVTNQVCTHIEYKHGGSILHIQTRKDKVCCPRCGNKDIVCAGTVTRDIKSLPLGNRPVTLRKTVQRIYCSHCGCTIQEEIPFAKEKCRYTKRLGRFIQDLCVYMTIKAVANFLGMSWNTVKEINKECLRRKYGRPDLHGLRMIGIDEFAVKKGHVYMTIVVDLETGRVVYVGDGKGKDALDGFWKRLTRSRCRIEAVSTDLSGSFISAVREHLPDATLIFDHFHIVKLANDTLDKVRIDTYKGLESKEKACAIKGLRWVLLGNGEQLKSDNAEQRLKKALAVNADLATSYYLKEDLRRVWNQTDKEVARTILHNWIKKALNSGIRHMKKLADTIEMHIDGILAYYDYKISSGKVEGINNKIKTIKRQAFGFRDDVYFKLRILAMHDDIYAKL